MPKRTAVGILLGWMLAAAPPTPGAETVSTYPLRGVLQAVDEARNQATIAHEEVRGYMPAMTMAFDLGTPEEIRGLRAGDHLTCQLRVAGNHAWIEHLHKVSGATAPPPGAVLPAERSTELNVGDPLPDIALTDQHGAPRRLRDFEGQPLAVTFIYLGCPLPSYCPLMNRNFQAAQALSDRLGLRGKARFLSLSMDPENDTPARLADLADALEADGNVWTFGTAPAAELTRLGNAVGLEVQRQGGGGINHNLRTVVVDGRGCIRRVFRGNTWTPQELVAEMRAAGTQN